ncbi:CDP-diacylglycerol-glycerol-3-phosphate 3-phosphatidyltransferase [Lentinula raphanica]|uniref:CDP-diacylglycerol--glycerol-3-phosphate 3-phosphatidyltransferase n=1 Tax=Lentinula raphanica TaxID=153919 RepID=A0AA38P1P7_9AGAR|nr:CDP-diacylglycerol-glycerol-3-phosphate 3-phosphatidyltransferase [Lentinula raphanica]KAJ3834664.1 CDP-diacylglycerol-glycerol-3-phosphate 3-phosphatidyltransferase [Lentinula raphanica]KAJ3965117.1 CDP-diacylglycerol-glycerol-3-phosphate 3-phosphatidyltransferase [Lentinula raphanica]
MILNSRRPLLHPLSRFNNKILSTTRRLSYNNPIWKFQSTLNDLTAELAQHQPKYSISADGIRILSQPSEFYSALLNMIRSAEERIFLSSLYIGSSESELISTLRQRLTEKESLQLYVHLDFNRSTRPDPSSTANILLPLLRAFPDRVHVSLFRSPSLRGIMARIVPPRFNEGWGTWHAKIYGVDDDVIISGANLNKDYFTNRRDRYIQFAAQPRLSDYCFNFLQTITPFSYRLLPSNAAAAAGDENPHSETRGDYTLVWSDPETHPHHIGEDIGHALASFQSTHRSKLEEESLQIAQCPPNHPTVTIFPLIQAGQFNIREEERFFQFLFGHLKKAAMRPMLPKVGSLPQVVSSVVHERPRMDMTSGYFSLYKPYQKLMLLHPQVEVRIVAASPKANGFFGSQGISGRIPEGYTYMEQKFMKAVRRTAKRFSYFGAGQTNIELGEWFKDGWTYHAKGLWLSPSKDSPPVLSLFGSTNLNSRSADIDTELSFVMILPPVQPTIPFNAEADSVVDSTSISTTPNGARHATTIQNLSTPENGSVERLYGQLEQEVTGIREDVGPWQGGTRKVRWLTKVMVWLVGGKL